MLDDEIEVFDEFLSKTSPNGTSNDLTLEQFSGLGAGSQINLSTLHSSKGREFKVVILFGMDQGNIPRNNTSVAQKTEARRLFYVGFTRAEEELHIVYTNYKPSQFVEEVQHRLETGN
jgi:superfamily I DNA/RNA helicase